MLRVSFSIGSSEMREKHERFWLVLEKFLDGGDGAYMESMLTFDPIGVSYFLILDGHVEISPHDDSGRRVEVLRQ